MFTSRLQASSVSRLPSCCCDCCYFMGENDLLSFSRSWRGRFLRIVPGDLPRFWSSGPVLPSRSGECDTEGEGLNESDFGFTCVGVIRFEGFVFIGLKQQELFPAILSACYFNPAKVNLDSGSNSSILTKSSQIYSPNFYYTFIRAQRIGASLISHVEKLYTNDCKFCSDIISRSRTARTKTSDCLESILGYSLFLQREYIISGEKYTSEVFAPFLTTCWYPHIGLSDSPQTHHLPELNATRFLPNPISTLSASQHIPMMMSSTSTRLVRGLNCLFSSKQCDGSITRAGWIMQCRLF